MPIIKDYKTIARMWSLSQPQILVLISIMCAQSLILGVHSNKKSAGVILSIASACLDLQALHHKFMGH